MVKSIFIAGAFALVSNFSFGQTAEPKREFTPPLPMVAEWDNSSAPILGDHEQLVTILSTNDIHGTLEATVDAKSKEKIGGLAIWKGVFAAIKQGLLTRSLANEPIIIAVDSGDAFQGTLLSDLDQGQFTMSQLAGIGYAMGVPGNHAYDFGQNALNRLRSPPLVAANVYSADSLVDANGNAVPVEPLGCRPLKKEQAIDWSKAKRPPFVEASGYRGIVENNIRVALIGLDHVRTPSETKPSNVGGLCFDNEFESYVRVRSRLMQAEFPPDMFVLVAHNGDSQKGRELTNLVERLTADPEHPLVDAVVSGHTHFAWNRRINGIPVVQSGKYLTRFSRIDLVFDSVTHHVNKEKTRSSGGVRFFHESCPPEASWFCRERQVGSGREIYYENQRVREDEATLKRLAANRAEKAPILNEILGAAKVEVKKHRTEESPFLDHFTDDFLAAVQWRAKVLGRPLIDLAFVGAGGFREHIPPGNVTFERFYRILSFDDDAEVLQNVSAQTVVDILEIAAKTCGAYGAVIASGLKATYSRSCDTDESRLREIDTNAHVLRIESIDHRPACEGRLLYDRAKNYLAPKSCSFSVAIPTFLRQGGEGGAPLARLPFDPVQGSLGGVRELMAAYYRTNPIDWDAKMDGRWVRH